MKVGDFLALRRRSDTVKVALMLYLLAVWLGAQSVGEAWEWLRIVREPAEYVVVPGASGAALSAKLEALFEMDEVVSITPQWEDGDKSGNTLQAPAYRVLCREADLSGVTWHGMEALGFTLKDPGVQELQELQVQLLRVRIGYGFLACGLAFLAGWAMFKWACAYRQVFCACGAEDF